MTFVDVVSKPQVSSASSAEDASSMFSPDALSLKEEGLVVAAEVATAHSLTLSVSVQSWGALASGWDVWESSFLTLVSWEILSSSDLLTSWSWENSTRSFGTFPSSCSIFSAAFPCILTFSIAPESRAAARSVFSTSITEAPRFWTLSVSCARHLVASVRSSGYL